MEYMMLNSNRSEGLCVQFFANHLTVRKSTPFDPAIRRSRGGRMSCGDKTLPAARAIVRKSVR
jgi:hypothetical protein